MFTGLVEALCPVVDVQSRGPAIRLVIDLGALATGTSLGDSVAINGCCLTCVDLSAQRLGFDAGQETLQRTNLGRLQPGSRVNVERSLQVGDRLGGHFVTGHIDAVATLDHRDDAQEWSTFWFRFPSGLRRQLASKGSIAVDGVSLTLVEVEKERFSVALIPHTLAHTTLGQLAIGATVNLETDLLAKYVEQQISAQQAN